MRIPACTFALLLFALPCIAQQSSQSQNQNADQNSSQNSNQSQGSSQSQSKDQSQSQSQSDDKSQPDKTDPAKRHSTAQDNPFPEAISRKAAAEAGDSTADAPAPSTTSAPSSGKPAAAKDSKPPAPDYSSSRTGLQNIDSDDPEARISDGAGGYIHDPKLAGQDVKVGQFYFVNQDYKGAYARFKEATRVDPANADAVFGLAEAARALKLTDEAADNYRIYLDAFPDGSKAKSARKALAQLGGAPKK